MSALPTGTVTFLFTDIEGSTPLWEQDPGAMRVALDRHHAILQAAIDTYHGHVFNIAGDAFCAAFANATDALAAALDAQRELHRLIAESTSVGRPSSVVLRVRMGLHTGQAEAADRDYRSGPTL